MSLMRLGLRDFVLTRSVELDLSNGFTALTGETGAGKSMLIDALKFVTGARADAQCVREGATRAEVSAEFDDLSSAVCSALQDAGLDEAPTLLLRRQIDTQGRSRAWINGASVTATQLRELGQHLLDIHGQHAWASLTHAEGVRQVLDAYGRIDLAPMQTHWTQWRQAQALLEQARAEQDSLSDTRERLRWQLDELDRLAPQADEWASLQAEQRRLAHVQSLLQAAQDACDALTDAQPSARGLIDRSSSTLDRQTALEPAFANCVALLASCQAQLDDVVHDLHAYLRRTEADPARLQQLDERIGQWVLAARRFRHDPEELPQLHQNWRSQLDALDARSDLASLQQQAAAAEQSYLAHAQQVRAQRLAAAGRLAQDVSRLIQDLGMTGGCVQIVLEPSLSAQSHGLDTVQFLLAGHAGSTPRALGKVASGGELSRVALALAVTSSALGSCPCLIFDEVDAGIGGRVADTVGQLMRRLGQDRQVLCVTHLAQVAASAHHQFGVLKSSDAQGTHSSLAPLEGAERVRELARMLGGADDLHSALQHAQDLLARHT